MHITSRPRAILKRGRKACARFMYAWPIRLLVVVVGIIMCDSTVRWIADHLVIHVFNNDLERQRAFTDFCHFLIWFFRAFFIAVFFAKSLPRLLVVALFVFSCASYGVFLAAHFSGFYNELWKHRESIPAMLFIVLAELPRYIEYRAPPVSIYSPVVFLVFIVLRHLISVLTIAFLWEVAFGDGESKSNMKLKGDE